MSSHPTDVNAPTCDTRNSNGCGGIPGGSGGVGGAASAAYSELCVDACGRDTGDCDDHSSSSYSENPVRYASGEIRMVSNDLSSTGFGLPWGTPEATATW